MKNQNDNRKPIAITCKEMDENTWLFILIGSKKKSYDGVKKIREQRISINKTNFYVTTDRK